MNDGLIARRYANALLLFSREEQAEDRVYADAQALIDALQAGGDLTAGIKGLSAPMQKSSATSGRNT